MNNIDKPANDSAERLKTLLKGNEALFPTRLYASYPNIVEKICLVWPEPRVAMRCFDELLTTYREKREGFPYDIHHEIFLLSTFYSATHPIAIRTDDFWSYIDTR